MPRQGDFLHGLPHWSIAIALEKDKEIVAAVIHDPIKHETFSAEKGGGAFSNSKRLRVAGRTSLNDALVTVGNEFFGSGIILPNSCGIRRMGSACLDLAYVAAGRFDAYWEMGLQPWDNGAGCLLVREAGGYHVDTVAEDADLTMALLRNGYRVQYEDMALAYTEAPTNANGLMRQRFRWSFGILQAVWKHSEVIGRKGALGFVALPNIIIFQILLPLVSPFIDIMFAVSAIWYFVQKHFHPDSTDPASFHKLVAFFFAFLVTDFVASALAFALERRRPDTKEDMWLLSQVWLQRFAYRQLFSVVLFKTLMRALEGRKFAWDKLERTAEVSYTPSERESVKV